jgi:hypothetical protein
VSTWSNSTASTRAGGRSESLERAFHEVAQLVDLAVRHEGASLDAAEVEQVGDEPREVLRLAVDGRGARDLLLRAQPDVGVEERSGSGSDRGQRRAQVVGDRVEQGRLERLPLAQDLRIARLGHQPIAFQGLPDLVRRRWRAP